MWRLRKEDCLARLKWADLWVNPKETMAHQNNGTPNQIATIRKVRRNPVLEGPKSNSVPHFQGSINHSIFQSIIHNNWCSFNYDSINSDPIEWWEMIGVQWTSIDTSHYGGWKNFLILFIHIGPYFCEISVPIIFLKW